MLAPLRKGPSFANFGGMLFSLPSVALLGGMAYAQDYTGAPNNPIGDVQTVYDGIGDVTPLPGGTSVLERVLYTVGQLNLTSPGSVAPVNGVYANIAESVALREWYSTDRTEVAYQDYVEDVIQPETMGLLWQNMVAPPEGSDFSLSSSTITDPSSGTEVPVGDVEFVRLHGFMLSNNRLVSPPDNAVLYRGTLTYTLAEFQSLVDDGFIMGGATLGFDAEGNVTLHAGSGGVGGAVIIEIGGRAYELDTLPDSIGLSTVPVETDILPGFSNYGLENIPYYDPDTGTLDMTDTTYDGDRSSPSYNLSSDLENAGIVWEGGVPTLRFADYIATNGLEESVASYDYEIVTPTDFTRQLDSFYEDWNQREFSTVIDGSVTNVINGVTEATERAVTSAATAIEFTVPTIDIGDIATTALGAVNTGDITVGVNSAVDEASASTTRAIQSSLTVVGGSAETGTMMLNVAHNTSIIRGNVENTLVAVNGSVGDISTTALGAVNTGTITNGVNAAVQGIVGMSGQY
ncbi:hypothetical protein [Phaeobacter gallaeciensis]|uniref:hypothetical protein n=1 Tax=Phaeobacter gallaeciensis TaxID=60890 RepID=UPI00237F9B4C|nr:hypothetical protein [Phaeobacter gallaeciensis]MDE4142890.1 hypothetical protein [Phaeobacter gallaeciensis]MDE4151335.1 hypothetical protein [Phaeobacter gallaeciensis]MDE4155565.1 hypothetical protein [Phaeobacter gallaeciensis]MDE4230958.1 hypothetical protein [Phaeobacter gallaeciensis]MDE4259980.1 hypothetical protein [Phaeobacter gallaeciensis]